MEKEFEWWMKWFGKTHRPFKLKKGSFLDEDTITKIRKASLIFVNNFKFDAKLDSKLMDVFNDMKDGAQIVSPKSFCRSRMRKKAVCNNPYVCCFRKQTLPK